MRGARILLPIALALVAAACARQQQTYYVIDPATGRPVPVVQQYNQPSYGQTYAQQPYGQSASRGLFGSPQAAQQAYAQPQYAPASYPQAQYAQSYAPQAYAQSTTQPQYAQPTYGQNTAPPQPSAPGEDRGLFNTRRGTQTYAAQPYAAQPYAAQPYGPQNFVYQYRPPQAAAAPYAAAPYGYAYAPQTYEQPYTLDAGDKLRVVVFGQDGISGTYLVDAAGNVSLPLVGSVPARGFTTGQLAKEITDRLKQGYVREPHVTVAVDTYRPFFILGEVTNPGQYPYVPNMTVENAIAIAGGFTPRAKKQTVEITRNAGGQRFDGDVPLNYPLRPGDTVMVKERWF
jgi:protein involved in polysaccharide export with SLBB domain